MKRKIVFFLVLLCLWVIGQAETAPPFRVFVNGTEKEVYMADVCHSRTWTSHAQIAETPVVIAEAEGETEIKIHLINGAEAALVRPLAANIEPKLQNGEISFVCEAPCHLTVEFDGQVEGALHLFLEAEDGRPEIQDEHVRYFGPGIHDVGQIIAQDDDLIYLDSGCVLHGSIFIGDAENVTVAGHGILSGEIYDRWADTVIPINVEHSRQIQIRDITILDPAAWMLQIYASEDVTVQNVKMIGACSNSDGITVQSSRNVHVADCFVRAWDDALVVKGYDGDVSDILFERIQIWSDLAQSCEIGYETRADVMENIIFQNITVLHNFHKPVISIHNSDNASIRNVLFENIIVEDAEMGEGDGQPYLIDLTTTKSQWSKTKERGTIRDVVIQNVTVLSGKEPSIRIFSFNREFNIDDVQIENLMILGKKITEFNQVKMNISPKNGENITISYKE